MEIIQVIYFHFSRRELYILYIYICIYIICSDRTSFPGCFERCARRASESTGGSAFVNSHVRSKPKWLARFSFSAAQEIVLVEEILQQFPTLVPQGLTRRLSDCDGDHLKRHLFGG